MQINVCVSEENTFLVENLLSLFPPLTTHTAATESIKQSCDPKIKKNPMPHKCCFANQELGKQARKPRSYASPRLCPLTYCQG